MTDLTTEKQKQIDNKWVSRLCDQLSESTGWPLRYLPAGQHRTEEPLSNDKVIEHCWVTEIRDELQVVGHLQIDLPESDTLLCSFTMMRELMELMGDLISRCLVSENSAESRSEELSALASLNFKQTSPSDLMQSLKHILDTAVQLSGFWEAAFYLIDPKTNKLHLRARSSRNDFSFAREHDLQLIGPNEKLLQGEHHLIRKSEAGIFSDWLPGEAATALGMPVVSETGVLGVIWLGDRRDKLPTERDLHVLQSIAAKIGQMLERLVLQQESEIQHRMHHDLTQAAICQPDQRISKRDSQNLWETVGICASRFELGGDLFELIPLDETRTLFAAGDASGDSVPAAMVMSTVRGAIRSLSALPVDSILEPQEIMSRLNKVLYDVTPSHQFMSMLVGILDTEKQEFSYCNAGHPTPFFGNQGEIEILESHGVLLGVLEETDYEWATIKMQPEDLLVFYSDGISEAMNQRKKLFRSDGIQAGIENSKFGSAQEVFNEIWTSMEGHSQDGEKPDDRTLVVLKLLASQS